MKTAFCVIDHLDSFFQSMLDGEAVEQTIYDALEYRPTDEMYYAFDEIFRKTIEGYDENSSQQLLDVVGRFRSYDYAYFLSFKGYSDYEIGDDQITIYGDFEVNENRLCALALGEDLYDEKMQKFLDKPIKTIKWINGEYKVETTEGEKFTVDKNGNMTIDKEKKQEKGNER